MGVLRWGGGGRIRPMYVRTYIQYRVLPSSTALVGFRRPLLGLPQNPTKIVGFYVQKAIPFGRILCRTAKVLDIKHRPKARRGRILKSLGSISTKILPKW